MDVYKIGVSIALANGVSAVLAVIQKDVLGLKKAVDLTSASMNRMKLAVGGLAGVTIGGLMLSELNKLGKAGEKYTHQLSLMRDQAGMTFQEIELSRAQADKTARNVLTTVPSENLKAIRELRAVFPHFQDALGNLDTVQRASAVMANLRDASGNRHGVQHGTEQVYEMSKAAEMQGAAMDPARFARMIDGMVKASQWSGGKITGSDFHSMLKYMRGAGVNLSDRFIMEMLPSLIQEFKTGKGGASGVGVGFAGLMRYVVGGHMSHRSIQAGLDYGLVDPSKVIRKPNGSIAGLKERAFYGSEMAQSDPDQWVDKYVLPILKKHGVDVNDQKRLTSVINAVFEGRVSQQWIEQFMLPTLRARLNADVPKINESGGVAAYQSLARTDPVMVEDQFHKQMERIHEDLGRVVAPMRTEFLYQLTQALSKFADVIERHPVAAKWLLTFVAALSGLMIVLGTLAVGAAALSAIGGLGTAAVVAGILAIGGALAWLAGGVNWSGIGAGFRRARSAVKGWVPHAVESMRGWGTSLRAAWDFALSDAAPSGDNKVIPAISEFIKKLVFHLSDAILEVGTTVGHKARELLDAAFGRSIATAADTSGGKTAADTSGGKLAEATIHFVARVVWHVADAILRLGDEIGHKAREMFNAAASAVVSSLESIASAIMKWAGGLPGKIGGALLDHMTPGKGGPSGVPEAPGVLMVPGAYSPPPSRQNDTIQVRTAINLDGRQIAENTSMHQARYASGPSRGTAGPDLRIGTFGGMSFA
ncbi:MAG: hypothetical protein NVSMB20_03120 [Bradyrhizobium sp.]